MKNNLQKTISMYILIGMFSAFVFIFIYGYKVLNPTYTDWLKTVGSDLTQHYLGWKAYRKSNWHFPIGMVDTLAYPHLSSIIFTDSIPIMAVFFKLLSPILPKEFQYFGLWGIMCFVLHGILAARIIKNYTNNSLIIIILSIIFLFTPIMLFRMFVHTSLAGQWILLLGLEPIFAHKKYQQNNNIYLIIALMGLLSASIHIYFVLMSAIILVGICLTDIVIYRNFRRSIILFTEYLLTAVLTMWLLGGFSGGLQNSAYGLGSYSFNINSFFNAQNWSCIFKSLPLYDSKQSEGFAYLGAGFIIMLIFCLILFLGGGEIRCALNKHRKHLIILCVVSGIAIITAISPVVTFGEKKILELKLPTLIIHLWAIFRSSGRVAWIPVYIIMICICIAMIRLLNKKTLIILSAFGLILQIYDIHDVIDRLNKQYNADIVYNSTLKSNLWNNVAQNNKIQHIVYCGAMDRNLIFPLTDWAMDHSKTMSNFYFARSDVERINQTTISRLSNPSANEIFIFTDMDKNRYNAYNLHCYRADRYIIGYVENIDSIKEVGEFNLTWNFGNNQYISDNGGTDAENGRELYSSGISYGPYWTVPAGNYNITIVGNELTNAVDIALYSGHGTVHYDYTVINSSESQIVLNLSLDQDTSDLEIYIKNNTQNTIYLKEIRLES